MTAMQDRVINVISKDPAQRPNPEIDILLPWLRKKSQLLQSMEKHVIMDIIRNCQYQKNTRDDVIIKQGDRGDRFYIILAGSVAVFVDAIKSGEEEVTAPPPPPPPEKKQTSQVKSGDLEKKEDSQDGEKKKQEEKIEEPVPAPAKPKKLDRSAFGKFVIKFGTGRSFGEIALISEDNVRNASIIADEECHFLVIHRDLYNKTLKASQEQEYADRKEFVETHPLFSRWSSRFRRLLEMSITKEVFTFDSVIQRQGDPVNGLIFIRKGRGKVIVEPGRHGHQYPNMYPFPATNDVFQLEHLRPNKKPLGEVQTNARSNMKLKQEQIAIRRKEGYAAAEKKILYRSIGLCCVEEGEVLGDIEMTMSMETAMQTVITTTYTECYMLNSKNFDRLVTKKNPGTIDLLRMMVETKLASRVNTQQGSQVPLIRYSLFKLVDEIIPPPKKLPPPLRGTKELPDRETLMQHLFDVFSQNKAALVEPYVPGAIYYREMMRDKARIRRNIHKRKTALNRKEKLRTYAKAVTKFPRSIAKIKASLEEERKDEEERLVEEIRREQEEQEKIELSRALNGVSPFQLLASQNLPPIFQNELRSPQPAAPPIKSPPKAEKLPPVGDSAPTMVGVRKTDKDTRQVLQVNRPVFITEQHDAAERRENKELSNGQQNQPDGEREEQRYVTSDDLQNTNQDTEIKTQASSTPENEKKDQQTSNSQKDVNVFEMEKLHQQNENEKVTEIPPDDPSVTNELQQGRNPTASSPASVKEVHHENNGDDVNESDRQDGDNTNEDQVHMDLKSETVNHGGPNENDQKISENTSDNQDRGEPYGNEQTIPENTNNNRNQGEPYENEQKISQNVNDNQIPTGIQTDSHVKPENSNNRVHLPEITQSPRTRSNVDSKSESPADKTRMRFVNAYVQHRLKFIHENPIYRDWETSDKTLSFLEERIKNFTLRTEGSPLSAKNRSPLKLPKLKRYQVQEGDLKQPIPGGKVWMKTKPCRLVKTKNDGHHQHQRYFMVPKLPEFERLKRTRMLLHYFMDQTIDNKMNEPSEIN